MGSTSIGEIGLDLVVNQKQFDKQMKGVNALAKKAGIALAAAFSVKKLVDFGKSCMDLGSDLNEVQNVVDTAFPNMNAQIDKFAKNAATQFGLSETMSKRYAGAFGSMAKAFGFTESAATDMSTTLTGLAGDVASFYNISQDEAYTKLKSVFTGETESLKDLGVVMTQSALDAYALANGFGKTTKSMSEAEKVALRYQFVQSKLADAQGDFARTSDGWANQVRILKLQFDSLKATIGQGLINLFTPIIKVINTLLGKLSALANAFKSFTEMIMGKKSASSAASVISDVSSTADTAASSVGGVGDAATDTAKKVKAAARALMGFDQINKVSDNDSDSSSGSSGGGSSVGGSVDSGLLNQETLLDVYEKKTSDLIDRVKELAALFKQGFEIGFGNSGEELSNISADIENIGKNFKEIFTNEEVVNAANSLFNSIAENAGKIAGSMTSIGVTLASNLTGGISEYLDGSKDYIKEKLVSIFNASADISDLVGDYTAAVADIYSIFSGENATKCTASIIGIFSDGFMGATEVALKFGKEIISVITDPFVNNKDKIKEAIDNTLGPISTVLETMHDSVKNTFTKISKVFDDHIAPMLQEFKDGLSDIAGKVLDGYNENIAPVWSKLGEKFSKVYKESIQPALDSIIDLFGKIADLINTVWKVSLEPFITWVAENIMPVLAPALEKIGNAFVTELGKAADVIKGVSDTLGGLITYIDGAFSGDWNKVWKGVKDTFVGIWDTITGLMNIPNVEARATLKAIKDKNFDSFTQAYHAIKDKVAELTAKIGTKWNEIKEDWKNITKNIQNKTASMKAKIGTKWKSLKGSWNTLLANFKDKTVKIGISIAAKVSDIKDWFNKHVIDAVNAKIHKVPFLGSVSIPHLASGGYVKKNTPQLAMIGDNRHQGEVVAPEDKLTEMARKAAMMAGGGTSPEVIALLKEILAVLKALDPNTYLDGKLIKTRIVDLINANTQATGVCEINV